jgi:exosortase C (VPDSG-CTERM-specific)
MPGTPDQYPKEKSHSMPDPEPAVPARLVFRRQLILLAVVAGLLLLCFGRPLLQLITFSLHDELFSYIPLIPFISAYFIWINRQRFVPDLLPCWFGAIFFGLAGSALVTGYWIAARSGWLPAKQDYLSLMTLSFLCFFWGGCLALLGSKMLRQVLFPAAFLIFAVPLPTVWMAPIDTFFQYTSATAAQGFFGLYGTPVLRDGLDLHLPGFALTVAPECSGIHSTLVLFMTSFMAGYLFLDRSWQRALLVLAVVPLAILRNGFRIFVVGELCVHIGPDMINSPIHRKGGPIFFALSLIPFLLFLVFLRRLNPAARPPLKPEPQP